MDTLEKSPIRIQEICEKIRIETLDPAKLEAASIIERAKIDADKLLVQARLES